MRKSLAILAIAALLVAAAVGGGMAFAGGKSCTDLSYSLLQEMNNQNIPISDFYTFVNNKIVDGRLVPDRTVVNVVNRDGKKIEIVPVPERFAYFVGIGDKAGFVLPVWKDHQGGKEYVQVSPYVSSAYGDSWKAYWEFPWLADVYRAEESRDDGGIVLVPLDGPDFARNNNYISVNNSICKALGGESYLVRNAAVLVY